MSVPGGSSDDEAMVGFDDLMTIGEKIVEMAERVEKVDPAVPGARMTWVFEMEDTKFKVTVEVHHE